MSMSKYTDRESSSPVIVPGTQIEEQPSCLEEPEDAENPVQLEFLKFLKNLDDVPNQIAQASHDADADADGAHEVVAEVVAEDDADVDGIVDGMVEANEDVNDAAIAAAIAAANADAITTVEMDPDDILSHVRIEIQFDPSDLQVAGPQIPNLNQLTLQGETATEQPLESLLSHNFLHKLHLAASSDQVPFINWTPDGEQLQLDYLGLQEHLGSSQCMFRSRSMTQFIRQLTDVGFDRVVQSQSEPEDGPQIYYEHACFKAYQLEELLLMSTPQFERQPAQHPATAKDAPSSLQTSYSPLQLARFRFQTLLNYHNDVRLLQEREPQEHLLPRRGRSGTAQQPITATLAPSLASKHTNPRDSVLQFEAGKVPDYAGFYGQVEHTLICQFFSEYLPRYGTSTSGYKDIVVDATKTNSFQQNLPIGIVYSEDEEDSGNQDNQRAAETKSEPPEPASNVIQPSEDIELEQVIQELCDVEALKPKLKRKRGAKKSAVAAEEMEYESPTDDADEELIHAAADADDYVATTTTSSAKNSTSSAAEANQGSSKGAGQNAAKGGSKHRRYDLRKSKAKRPR